MGDSELRESFVVLAHCLSRALRAMNEAVRLTTEQGPAVAMESIADFLSNTDGLADDVADATPDDWLTRWSVARVSALTREAGFVEEEGRG